MMRIVLGFGLRHPEGARDCGLFTRHRRGGSLFRNPKSEIRNALTLIELMVVIVILMTLVGGVIPVLSPNNEARKIRDATRGLQTYVMQAQARAARTGRPTGIAFRETSAGSGAALDVFQIEIPPPFAGFSSSSSAIFYLPPDKITYEIRLGEGFGEKFIHNDDPVVPPLFVKPGDLIEVGTGLFQLGYTNARNELEIDDNGVRWFLPTSFFKSAKLISGSAPPTFALDYSFQGKDTTHPNRYRIDRQPVNTSESPYTLPAGVAIDMHASGTEGGSTPTLFALHVDVPVDLDSPPKQVGIMFSPNGGIDSVHYSNGRTFGRFSYNKSFKELPITDASRVFLLLGRVENVLEDMGSSPSAISEGATDEQLAELQQRINWLNLDSRWIAFDTRSGRSVVTANTFVDARRIDLEQFSNIHTKVRLPWAQLDAARQFARQMRSGSGR